MNTVEINGSFYSLQRPPVTSPGRRQPRKISLRHTLNVRDLSYRDPEVVELLRGQGVALAVADSAGTWLYLEDVTAESLYVRLRGDAELYVSGYTDEVLDTWVQWIRGWQAGESC